MGFFKNAAKNTGNKMVKSSTNRVKKYAKKEAKKTVKLLWG